MVVLTGPLPVWDLERRHVDVDAFTTWIVETARAFSVDCPRTLDRWHETITSEQALALSKHLTLQSRATRPRSLVHAMLRAALPELPWRDVVVQTAAHVRVLVPGDALSPAPLHTDRAIGHGLDERNVWIAMTDARASAALHAMPLASSIAAEVRRKARRGVTLDVPPHALAPLNVVRGDVVLFTPVHVHAAHPIEPNDDVTRVSIDVRIAPAAIPRDGAGFSFVPAEAA
jgi:hypothetical protein